MKVLLFAAALMASGAALAQTDPATTDEPTATTTTTDDTVADPSMTTTNTMTTSTSTVAPSNAAPERDARGIAVISAPAVAPAGTNQAVIVPPGAVVVANPNAAAAFQTQASTSSYPACTRAVTDHCVQTYERGRPR
jgi:hypothetical protein